MILHCRSYYSLRFGMLAPSTVASLAAACGFPKVLLADINNCTGWVDFIKQCRSERIEGMVGMEFRRGSRLLYVCMARNMSGFQEINEYLTQCNMTETQPADFAPPFNQVFVLYPWNENTPKQLRANEYIAVRPSQVPQLRVLNDRKVRGRMVAWWPVTFGSETDYDTHCHLRAIDNNTLLSNLKSSQLAMNDEIMPDRKAAYEAFSECPDLLANAENLLRDCSADVEMGVVRNKKTFTGSRYDDKLLLEKLAMDGFPARYPNKSKQVLERIRKELEIIDRLGFSSYFLMAWDIVRYSMSRGFYHVGRGSGANSIVAYCLYITNVDPVELDLYFERFINPKRTSPPDFDIDFSWKDRTYVQDYIFKRYGSKHTALLGMMQTFRDKSVYRELGKVYGLPKTEIDALVEERKTLKADDDIIRKIVSVGEAIRDFPNLRSIHAGGVLVSEDPITMYSALDRPPKGMPTVQWDMYVAEDLGYEKFDILSQRGIGHIGDAVKFIAQNRREKIDIHDIPAFKRDPAIAAQIEKGETIGCFYVESPAMRSLLKKLDCRDYLTLVAASSIIRPGVSSSGMMQEYIRRYHNPQSFQYLHPVLEELLHETYGVMVYQEDVLKVVHHYAGLDLAEADVLRRAMSGKYRSKEEMMRIVNGFHEGAAKMGRPEEVTRELWRQIESFSGYSFSKAHSASFAVESYQSLFLKAHYPVEFMTAVINNFGGYYRSWVYFSEARRSGANVLLPCINTGDYITTVKGNNIRIGFIHVQGLEENFIRPVLEERLCNGPFADMADFVSRIHIAREQLVLLIRTGAFIFTGKTKPELLWETLAGQDARKTPEASGQLFASSHQLPNLPPLETSQLEDAYDEIELLGFPVTYTWFDLLKTSFRGEIHASGMKDAEGKYVRMIAPLVTIKPVRTKKNEKMYFASFIDFEGNFFETVHFPDSLRKYPFRGNGVYLLYGKVINDFGALNLQVEKMAKMELRGDPRA
ncbi:MAG: DNA polymerase III subunit alpha [Bacteroidetes bacterium GWF2_43_63]|nr:MAG: DNA polymerase III subunit alpha [Bacteroidetes bacterium GWE2_42_42]OFY56015.1 MAG: DNA polymerase III subunit alpha [Bacteroidetes bacterium GWF2_43_63]HBG70742.1 DNA polymerase III subunit alpha [Bacteroidales bacterium]HCB62430.1 DNA polymerase III subunit alpha [Bacteroidales bacterium]HCY21885.1 DNA polymerase III subunit alpha [Bacteroidales bacterium]